MLRVDLEGHGREPLFEDVDLSRTVGWFTIQFPVLLDLRGTGHPGEAIVAAKEQLRAIPGRGIGYGLLRWATGDEEVARMLRGAPRAEISFNYLGQFGQSATQRTLFQATGEPTGSLRSPRSHRTHLLEVSAAVAEGRMRVTFNYSDHIHLRSTMEELVEAYAEELRGLIAHCRTGGEQVLTASDFPMAGLDETGLHKLSALLDDMD